MEVEKKIDWALIVGGVLLFVCGLGAALFPGLTLVTMTSLVGAGFLISGVADAVFYARNRKALGLTGWALAYAVVDVLIGLMFLLHPLALSGVIPWLVGVFFIAFGVFEVMAGFKSRKLGIPMWGMAVFSGAVNLLAGIGLVLVPASVVFLIALFALWRGAMMVIEGAMVGKLVAK